MAVGGWKGVVILLNKRVLDAFISPRSTNASEIHQVMQATLDLITSYVSTAADRTPLPTIRRDAAYRDFPETGRSAGDIMQALRNILDQSLNPSHPRFMGHMDSIPTIMSIVGDLVSAGLNNNMLSLEMSPVLSQMEMQVLQEVGRRFGYGETARGVMLSGGTLANLQALTVARNCAFPTLKEGFASVEGQPVIFTSEVAHTSVHKAAMVMGIGTSGVIPVRTNTNSQMIPADLEKKIHQAVSEGRRPFAIVATAGTTVTGSIDPLAEIARIASRYQLWLHVDAAYGGALVFSTHHRHRIDGIEEADSIAFNPQKWMYVAKTCAMVLFKDGSVLETAFRIAAPYMNDTDFINIGEISVQGTRHADILKLWLSLQHVGTQGYAQLIDASYDLVESFVQRVNDRPYLELDSMPDTNLCCFRGTPPQIPEEEWDQWNLTLQQALLRDAHTFLSLPTYRGRRWLRAVLLNPFTSQEDICRVFERIDQQYKSITER